MAERKSLDHCTPDRMPDTETPLFADGFLETLEAFGYSLVMAAANRMRRNASIDPEQARHDAGQARARMAELIGFDCGLNRMLDRMGTEATARGILYYLVWHALCAFSGMGSPSPKRALWLISETSTQYGKSLHILDEERGPLSPFLDSTEDAMRREFALSRSFFSCLYGDTPWTEFAKKLMRKTTSRKSRSRVGISKRVPTARHIYEALDAEVVGHEGPKRLLAQIGHQHAQRALGQKAPPRSNVLLIGPTGTGKTLLARTLADVLGLPLVIFDCTTLTEAGYYGNDPSDALRPLLASVQDMHTAQRGVVLLDEVDKLSLGFNVGGERSAHQRGKQEALLALLHGLQVQLYPKQHNTDAMFDTSETLFIGTGVFKDMINEARGTSRTIGFRNDESRTEIESNRCEPLDLVECGFIPEFAARWSLKCLLKPLTEDDLIRLALTSSSSPLLTHAISLETLGLSEFDLRAIAVKAVRGSLGARGLFSELETLVLEHQWTKD